MPHSNISRLTRIRAKELRGKRTKAEMLMWNLLREFNRNGTKFRWETPIGPYIADFAWLSARIVIEVDGDTHSSAHGREHDLNRDEFMRKQGFNVLRFSNADIGESLEGAFLQINDILPQPRAIKDPTP